jgi:transposase
MKKRDFRGLDEKTQAELRRMALKKIDEGWSKFKVANLVEVHYKTIENWNHKRKKLQKNDFLGEKRGRVPDEQKILEKRQEEKIKDIIINKTPDKVGLKYALWTRKAIKELIEDKTGKKIVLETVSKYTKRWGLSPQRPSKHASEQNAEKIKSWLQNEYPQIQKRARKEGAEIHWEDETGIALNTFYARSYAPKGKTPTIKLPAKKISLSMISSITNQGKLRFMLYQKALNANLFIKFLNRLIKDTNKKIFLIADNLSVHKAKKVRMCVEKYGEKIEIFSPTSIRSTV